MTKTLDQLKQDLAAAQAAYETELAAAKKLKAYDRLQNEGGEGYSTYEVKSEALYNKHGPIINALEKQVFAAEWTTEVFAARRATWNEIMTERFLSKNINPTTRQLQAVEQELGFTFRDLGRAKSILAAK